MWNANHSRLSDFGMGHGEVLEFNRGYPFAARLNDVLRPIRNLHIAVVVYRCDVARKKPAIITLALGHLEIRPRDPGSANDEVTKRLAIVRQLVVVAVANSDFDPENGASLLDLSILPLGLRQRLVLAQRLRDCRDR